MKPHEIPHPHPKHFITLIEAYRSYTTARRVGSLRGQTLHAHWALLNMWQADDEAAEADTLPDCPDCTGPMNTDGTCTWCEQERHWQHLWH